MKTLEDIQKGRYAKGAVVYNTNNYQFGIVLDGNRGDDKDPSSLVLEITCEVPFIIHTPPNRALIPTGRFIDIDDFIYMIKGEDAR